MPRHNPGDRITLCGRLGAEPELRYTPAGKAVANLRLAVDQGHKDENGKWQKDEPVWYRVAVWEDQAEHVAESLKKGDRVVVEGQFKGENSREWEGKTYTDLEVTAFEVGASLKWNNVAIQQADRNPGRVSEAAGNLGTSATVGF